MVFDEYRSMQGGLPAGEQYKWSKSAAGRAFQGLAMCGLAAYTGSSRQVGRGAAFAPVQLRIGRQAFEAVLDARKADLPDLLIRFYKLEV